VHAGPVMQLCSCDLLHADRGEFSNVIADCLLPLFAHCTLASCPFCHEYSRMAPYAGVNPALIAIEPEIKAFDFPMKTQV